MDRPVPDNLDMGYLFYGHEVLQVECVIVKYKHMLDAYVTLEGWLEMLPLELEG